MPFADPAVKREYQRTYMAARRGGTSVDPMSRPFVGADGEGGNVETGYHAYFLLRIGDEFIVPSDGNIRLTSGECLRFIASRDPSNCYVAFFFDYDVAKILEDLPWGKLQKLMDKSKRMRADGRGWFPVDWGPYEIDYLPRKEFKVRWRGEKKWVVINDVGSFFQCRFTEAIEKWGIGTDAERVLIADGKSQRADFTIADLETIDPYNRLEIKLLQELMEKFRAACNTVGILPAKWQGPGQLAEAAFTKFGVPRSRDVPTLQGDANSDLLLFARNAFYGGRPEIMAIGPVNRAVHQWDINSAYPYAMLSVPCLIHGRWRHGKAGTNGVPLGEVSGDAGITLVYGSFRPRKPASGKKYPMWYGLPVRSKEGSICYPGSGRGWYWAFEAQGAIHQEFSVEECFQYVKGCDCQPLSFVQDLYAQRLALGKDDAGMVLKLALNSLYGKTVQSIGSPRYANPIWGSFITAYCRRMIQDFIHDSPHCKKDGEIWCGKDVLMIATDSVCTWADRTDVSPSKELGGWSVETHAGGMFLIQPGLYFGSSGKGAKTRGVPLSVVTEKEGEFRAAFDRMVASGKLEDGDVDVPQRLFVGIRLALHRRNLKLLGQWIEFRDPETGRTGKTIRFDWTTKRCRYPVLNPIPGVRDYVETFPKKGDPEIESVPYSRDIGGLLVRDTLRALYDGQPDWVPQIEPVDLTEFGV